MAKRLKGYKKIHLFGLEDLAHKRNLLGFSAGVDSTALFFLLLSHNIDFDIAIVDYGVRKQSKKEVKYAKNLAKQYNKHIFIHKSPPITTNFESSARNVRLEFFKSVISEIGYDNLILANQLNDRLEWFLMQFCKGCGLNSLLGFMPKTDFSGFRIIRPLFYTSRTEIVAFLTKNHIRYFIDKSNANPRFLRNYFRLNIADTLMKKYQSGITKSLDLLFDDKLSLYPQDTIHKLFLEDSFIAVFVARDDKRNLHHIDLVAKELGYVISTLQRSEIQKAKYSCVVADKIIIDSNKTHIFVTKNIKSSIKLTKDMREVLRKAGIPPRIRRFVDMECLEQLRAIVSGF